MNGLVRTWILPCLFIATAIAAAQQPAPRAAATWLRGDLHVHDDHSSDGSGPRQHSKDKAEGNVSIADQIEQAAKMGLQFLPLTDHRTYDQHYDPLWESASLLLIPAEEANGSPHATVLGGADSIVQGAARTDRPRFTHVQQSVWDAHSQDAIWTIAHADDGEMNDAGVLNDFANVQGVNLVEIWNRAKSAEKEIDYAENRWNAGFVFGVAGASDSHFRERWDTGSPGMPMTAVAAAAYNERGVLDALRAGHTTLSATPGGPFVTISTDVGGAGRTSIGGDEVVVPAGTKGHLRISAERAAGMRVLVYRKPGRSAGAFKTFVPSHSNETFVVDITAADHPDWYRVEVRGPDLKAAVSPIFISPATIAAVPDVRVPADQGQTDDATLALGVAGAFAGFPDVAADAGVVHVVAELHGDASSTVQYRRFQNDGFSSSDAGRQISGAGLARFPRVAARGSDVWIAWQEDARQVPHRPEIILRHSRDRGVSWEATQTVRAIEGRAEHPCVAITAGGRPLLVWQEIRAGQPMDVMVQEIGTDREPRNLSRAGKTIDHGVASDSRSPRYPASVLPSVAVASDGRVEVVWQDNREDPDPLWTGTAAGGEGTNPDNWQIMAVARDSKGAWHAPVSLGAADLADRHPDVAFSKAGSLVVVWESKALRSSGANLSVRSAASTDGGATFSAPVVVAPDAQTMSERPRLGVDRDGRVRAVWYDSRSADWRWRVMTVVYTEGAGWNAGVLMNARGINTWPATAGGVVAFVSTRNAARLQRDDTQQVLVVAGE